MKITETDILTCAYSYLVYNMRLSFLSSVYVFEWDPYLQDMYIYIECDLLNQATSK